MQLRTGNVAIALPRGVIAGSDAGTSINDDDDVAFAAALASCWSAPSTANVCTAFASDDEEGEVGNGKPTTLGISIAFICNTVPCSRFACVFG